MLRDDDPPRTFGEEEAADLRRQYVRHTIRLVLVFALIFAGVFYAFWWSGAAVRFGAARVADRAAPTWHVTGVVRNAVTRQPVAWAAVEDDGGGRPPFYRAEANQAGEFELATLPEPHRLRISAPGYRAVTVAVGRVWFLWLPSGGERKEVQLSPE